MGGPPRPVVEPAAAVIVEVVDANGDRNAKFRRFGLTPKFSQLIHESRAVKSDNQIQNDQYGQYECECGSSLATGHEP